MVVSESSGILDLNGDWQFRQADQQDWFAATVPGCNFTDLQANGLIDEPFYRDNENKLQWIEQKDWHYRKSFVVPANWLAQDIELVAEGLDTFCDLYLNGKLLGQSQNMFVGQQFACTELLQAGENLLELRFRSPINETLPQHLAAGYTYPAENDKSEEKLSVYCRKAPCHFGWDWGPRFVTSGIWRPIYLRKVPKARISNLHFVQRRLSAKLAEFSFVASYQLKQSCEAVLQVRCAQAPQLNQLLRLQLTEGQTTELKFQLSDPQLWWPNGLGEAFLYQFDFSLTVDGELLDQQQQKIGLRSLEVVNKPDADGVSFFIKVNGEPVFMKGANYIPGDSFIHRMTAERHQTDFAAVKAAHMNMLRVWGGGVYQDDVFYQLADENGILIWQDFMFACSLYPGDAVFMANVEQEVQYNIKRLRNHPCIALWCGNNEVDMGIEKWEWPAKFGYSDELFTRLKQEYMALFGELLPQQLQQLDPQRFYLRSSPGVFWEDDSDHLGNHHFWGVWHGEQPFSEYQKRIPRFMSEYGFQSFPVQSSMQRFTEAQDWDLGSEVLRVHQKHPRGNKLIHSYLQQEHRPAADFTDLMYLSQVQQAEGLKLAFEAHRAAMPFCMGTLYWQLNDTWPAASWSGIDYYGRWKALHYQAGRSFATDLLVITEQQQQLQIQLVSDRHSTQQTTLALQLLDFNGAVLWQQQTELTTPANASALVWSMPKTELLAGKTAEQLVFQARLLHSSGQLLTENLYYFVPAKQQRLTRPELSIQSSIEGDSLVLQLQSQVLVRHCFLEFSPMLANLSDNFFDVLPNQPKTIRLQAAGWTAQQLQALLPSLSWRTLGGFHS